MQKKNIDNKEIISGTCDNIRRIFPESKYVEIKVNKDQGKYESLIMVKAPKKRLLAKKSAKNYKASIDKSYEAIVRQIHKVKAKEDKKRLSKSKNLF